MGMGFSGTRESAFHVAHAAHASSASFVGVAATVPQSSRAGYGQVSLLEMGVDWPMLFVHSTGLKFSPERAVI